MPRINRAARRTALAVGLTAFAVVLAAAVPLGARPKATPPASAKARPSAGAPKEPLAPSAPATFQQLLEADGQAQWADLERFMKSAPRLSRAAPAAGEEPRQEDYSCTGVRFGSWQWIGPFDNANGKGFATEFGPEKSDDLLKTHIGRDLKSLNWAAAKSIRDGRAGRLNLFRGDPWSTVYLYRTMESEEGKVVRVHLGSGGSIAVWLNGRKVHAKDVAARPCRLGDDKVLLDLEGGKNDLLVKLSSGAGPLEFAFAGEPPPGRGNPAGLMARAVQQAFRRDAAILDTDRDPADVVLRRTAVLLVDLAGRHPGPAWAPLAARLKALKVRADQVAVADAAARQALYREVCALRRQVAFANPLLDFDRLVFIKKHPSRYNHMCDQYFGKNAVPGGGLYVLERPFGPDPKVVDVLAGSVVANGRLRGERLQGGCFLSPDLSWDARTLVFAWTQCQGAGWSPQSSFHIFKVNADGTGLVQLTDGPWNDFDPCFLPNGRIAFVSERRGGYGRCHGRPVPTYTLHSMNPDGSDIVAVSYHETNEWHPSVNRDGLIVYSRWDYVDRDSNVAHHPWITSPDGRDARSIHGNFPRPPDGRGGRPWMELDVKPIPGSHRYVSTASPHHGQAFGSLVILDPDLQDDDGMGQLARLTPDALFPEAEGGRGAAVYATAWPLSEHYYLCVHRPQAPGAATFGLYLLDAFGNRELLYRDEAINGQSPVPLRPQAPPAPVTHLAAVGRAGPGAAKAGASVPDDGTVACINVYEAFLAWPEGTRIEALRVIQLFPKATPSSGTPRISIASQALARGVLGTVPVEADGSAHFRLPAGKPVYFQALDGQGLAVQSMRSLTYVQPGQRLTCQGCHDHRQQAPIPPREVPLALRRPPSAIRPEAEGANPVLYPRLVQPVLDRSCVPCHRKEPKAPDLTGEVAGKGPWSKSYQVLAPKGFWFQGGNGGIRAGVRGGSRTIPGQFGALASPLYQMLAKGHHDVKLPPEDLRRITLWIDANTNFFGAYLETDRQARGEVVMPTIE